MAIIKSLTLLHLFMYKNQTKIASILSSAGYSRYKSLQAVNKEGKCKTTIK